MTAYDDAVMADAPWGYWKCNETSGASLADSSGNARGMTINGGSPTLGATGPDVFASSDQAISWPASSGSGPYSITAASLSTTRITIEGWFYLPAVPSTETVIVGLGGGFGSGIGDKQVYVTPDGTLRFFLYTSTNVFLESSVTVPIGRWNYVAASVRSDGVFLNLNGAVVASRVDITTSYPGTQYCMLRGGPTKTGVYDLAKASPIVTSRCAVYTAPLPTGRVLAHYAALPHLLSGTWGWVG